MRYSSDVGAMDYVGVASVNEVDGDQHRGVISWSNVIWSGGALISAKCSSPLDAPN